MATASDARAQGWGRHDDGGTMTDWRRRPGGWWPVWLPWIGVETWSTDAAHRILALPVRVRWRVLSVEWFRRGITIAAWEDRGR